MGGPQDPEDSDPTRAGNFLQREPDGSARVRIRFTAEEARLIEEAAGTTPVLLYMHRVLNDRARYHIRKQKEDAARRKELAKSHSGAVDGAPKELDGNRSG